MSARPCLWGTHDWVLSSCQTLHLFGSNIPLPLKRETGASCCRCCSAPPCHCSLAEDTHGYTGADLRALCREAAMCAVSLTAAGAAQVAEGAGGQQLSERGLAGAAAAPLAAQRSSHDADSGEGTAAAAAAGAAAGTQQHAAHVLRRLSAADFATAMKRVGPSMARGSAVEFEAARWAWPAARPLLTCVHPFRHVPIKCVAALLLVCFGLPMQLGRHWWPGGSEAEAQVRRAAVRSAENHRPVNACLALDHVAKSQSVCACVRPLSPLHARRQAVEWPLRHADAFKRLGLTPPRQASRHGKHLCMCVGIELLGTGVHDMPGSNCTCVHLHAPQCRGVLLHGPPGCSKTTLVRAAASASGATFISLSGAAGSWGGHACSRRVVAVWFHASYFCLSIF